ncbi:MAG: type I-U CRISPR-associated protein Csb2 [Planctomycetota bacterium]
MLRTDDLKMLAHYGIGDARHRTWRTVTPIAMSEGGRRRRITPTSIKEEAKNGLERRVEQERAAATLIQSLRHAEIRCHVESIRLQREPLTVNGRRAEAFAAGTRFEKERLWHALVTFKEPIAGPIVIGDGRFLGLGLLEPVKMPSEVLAFKVVDGLAREANPLRIARAMRLAVISRVQATLGRGSRLASYFTGHEDDGSPTTQPHLAFIFDSTFKRILVISPHRLQRRSLERRESDYLDTLERALEGMFELRAGSSGVLKLCIDTVYPESDPVFLRSRTWESVTEYVVTRHLKADSANAAFATNLQSECRSIGLPTPSVRVLWVGSISGLGLCGRVSMLFPTAVEGPIILGRNRHIGGGLFAACIE